MDARQTTFEYTDEVVRRLVRTISRERLQPYLFQARNDQWVAIQLYVRNTALSEALYGVLQAMEVLLRNAMNVTLSKQFGADHWYFLLPLHQAELEDIAEAEQAIANTNSTWLLKRKGMFVPADADPHYFVKPGRVVAELSFGFWVKLLSFSYEKDLWPHLKPIFPQKDFDRKRLHDRLMQLKTLRNRIAHHETLIKRDVLRDYNDLLETMAWISPTTRDWVTHTNCFLQRYEARIPKQPKTAARIDTSGSP